MEYVTREKTSNGNVFKTRCGMTAYVGNIRETHNLCNWCFSPARKVIGIRVTVYPKESQIKGILVYCAVHEVEALEAQEQTKFFCKQGGLGHYECFRFKESIPMLFRGEE